MHFNAGIEVDNWIKDKRGWYIGISLKRTLRERWKQTQTTESVLTSFKIKNIIHLINNDQDFDRRFDLLQQDPVGRVIIGPEVFDTP